jgi:hypothetical protein
MQNVHTPMVCPPSVHGGDCSYACKIKQSNATRSIMCASNASPPCVLPLRPLLPQSLLRGHCLASYGCTSTRYNLGMKIAHR